MLKSEDGSLHVLEYTALYWMYLLRRSLLGLIDIAVGLARHGLSTRKATRADWQSTGRTYASARPGALRLKRSRLAIRRSDVFGASATAKTIQNTVM